jgi:hypothetical protein
MKMQASNLTSQETGPQMRRGKGDRDPKKQFRIQFSHEKHPKIIRTVFKARDQAEKGCSL